MSSKKYNVVLLGETGTGKSLFINSFANYFHFDNLREAIESKERMNLIWSKFKVIDCNDIELIITSGQNDGNERTEVAESMTVKCKSYEFQLGNVSVRLIDTPRMGDTDGKQKDRAHIENILSYIKKLDVLHAIAIVVNNTQTKMTDRFSYCLKALMTIVNETEVDNIVFILTFAKANNFKPGNAKNVIEKFIKYEINASTLKLDRDRVYCFDNSGYELLIATQHGVEIDEDDFDSQDLNWRKSSVEMRRLLEHVTGLPIHQNEIASQQMRKTLSTKQKLEMNNDKMKTTANNRQYWSIGNKQISAKEYNILLLGETGTGKSLFINSFANYFKFDSYSEAIDSEERANLIYSKISVIDLNDKDHEITSGENDGNEITDMGESATVNCNSYKFQFKDVSVRLIDTPGLWNTRGEEADKSNVANILNYINNFEDLHDIGIVMRNIESKMTDRFNDCLKTLLTNLNKSAVDNIVFILTFSKGNNFKPGPVTDVIERFNRELKDSPLKLDKDRRYCFDNRSYEYIVATQHGVQFDQDDIDSEDYNWRKSTVELKRLITYVKGLTPHRVRETVSLNKARQFITIIYPILNTILQNIEENTQRINEYQENLQVQSEKVKDMENDVNLKQIDITIVPIDEAITFCTSPKCREIYVTGGKEKVHYPMQCCKGCTTNNNWRWRCKTINWKGYCKVCGCHKDEHDRRFYKTEKVSTNLFTDEDLEKIKKAKNGKEKLKMNIKMLRERRDQLILEQTVIENAEKKLAKYIHEHVLAKPPEYGFGRSYAIEYKVNKKYEAEFAQMKCMSINEFYQLKTTFTNLPLNGVKFKEILDANANRLALAEKEMDIKFFY